MEEDTLQIKTKHRIYTFISHLSLHTWEQKYYLKKTALARLSEVQPRTNQPTYRNPILGRSTFFNHSFMLQNNNTAPSACVVVMHC